MNFKTMKNAPWVPQNGAKQMDLTNVGCNRKSIYRIISYFRYMWVYNMYLSQMLVDLDACMETPLAARGRLVMFSVTVGYIQ